MSYLIDTNVLSELRRREADANVLQWTAAQPAAALHLSTLTLGELRKGIELVADSKRKRKLRDWLEMELPAFFDGRILGVDAKVADRWGRLVAQAGRPVPVVDSLLAATALTHGLTMVTRNLKDFRYAELEVLSPWSA